MNPITLAIIGTWLFCDGWISLSLYIGRENQSWIKDHSIRIIRLVLGLFLMIASYGL